MYLRCQHEIGFQFGFQHGECVMFAIVVDVFFGFVVSSCIYGALLSLVFVVLFSFSSTVDFNLIQFDTFLVKSSLVVHFGCLVTCLCIAQF